MTSDETGRADDVLGAIGHGVGRHGVPIVRPPVMSGQPRSRAADVRLFGPFRLDVGEQRLWRGNDELKLRRKPFAILRFLTANPLRLATQEEVVEAVWGEMA